jgi:PilZ domain
MLRYVFETALQLKAHLHPAANDAWLFYPDLVVDRKGGEVVPLEVELRQPGQQVMMRGRIHSRVGGTSPGIWVQFSDLRLARKLESDARAIALRQHPRVTSDLMVEIREADASARIARLLDVSAGGACLGAATGLQPGMEVNLYLLSGIPDLPRELGRGVVVRAIGGAVGIRFPPESSQRAQKVVEASRRAWKAARTVTHSAACCGPAGTLDPPVPRVRSDKGLR